MKKYLLQKSIYLLFCFILMFLLVSCSTKNFTTQSNSSKTTEKKPVLGIIIKTMSDPFARALGEAMIEKAKEYSNEIDYIWVDSQSDVTKQLAQFEDMIARKVDVLICAPQDAEGSSQGVVLAKEAGIPLILVNSTTTNKDYVTFVGSNDVEAGEIMGNFVKEKLKGRKAKVVQLEGAMGNSAQIMRNEGIEKTLLKDPNIELLAKLSADWQRDKAMNIMEDWLQKFPQIDAVLAENDDMAMGALEAIEAANRKGVIIVGVDGTADALQAIKDGRLSATVFQDAKAQGEKAVEVAVDIIKNGTANIEKEYLIPFKLVTKENVDDFIKK